MARRFHPVAVAHTTPEARRGRSLFERVVARFPTIVGPLTRAVLGLPEPVRRRQLAYLARRGYATYNRRDWEVNTLFIHPGGYVLDWGPGFSRPPDARESYAGVEGYLEFNQMWLDTFGDFRFELRELPEIRPDRVVIIVRQLGRTGGAGPLVDADMITVNEIRDGLTVRQTVYTDITVGLKELGLGRSGG